MVRKLFPLLAFLLSLAASCSPEPLLSVELVSSHESVTEESGLTIIADDRPNTIKLSVKSRKDWKAWCSASWITLSPSQGSGDGNLTVYTSTNTVYDEREATVKITSGDIVRMVTVRQIQNEGLSIAARLYEADSFGGPLEIAVLSNIEYDVTTDKPWVHALNTKGISIGKLTLMVDENTGAEERSAVVTLSSRTSPMSSNFTIRQSARTFYLDEDSCTVGFMKDDNATVSFSVYGKWTAEVSDPQLFRLSESQGAPGKNSIVVTALETNHSGDIESRLTIRTDEKTIEIPLSQSSLFTITGRHHDVSPAGYKFTDLFTIDSRVVTGRKVEVENDEDMSRMFVENKPYGEKVESICGNSSRTLGWNPGEESLGIAPNYSSETRMGKIRFSLLYNGETFYSSWVEIIQEGLEDATADYSMEGSVHILQKHTEGQGVPLILMGDGYRDVDIASGDYERDMKKCMDAVFSLEPCRSLQNMFDVMYVVAVSPTKIINKGLTRFNCKVTDDSRVEWDYQKCLQYAWLAVDKARWDGDVTVATLINADVYGGTAHIWINNVDQWHARNATPSGNSVAALAIRQGRSSFSGTACHEICGHGIGKLADEYDGRTGYSTIETLESRHKNYAYLNVTTKSDIRSAPWYKFTIDKRYEGEKLGMYEGAYYHTKGVYRPTESSVMRDNQLGGRVFNAPSREAIYKRIMSIGYRHTREYFFNDFVAFDVQHGLGKSSVVETKAVSPLRDYPQLPPPVIHIQDED